MQTLTDWSPWFFGVVGISGILELTGLALWGGHMVRLMLKRPATDDELNGAPPATPRPARIEAHHLVADVLAWHPRAMTIFEQFGFALLRNPVARRTLARTVTLGQAAKMRGVAIDELLQVLNESAAPLPAGVLRYDMPVEALIASLPGAEKVLAAAGVNLHDGAGLSLGEAADRAALLGKC